MAAIMFIQKPDAAADPAVENPGPSRGYATLKRKLKERKSH